MAEKCADKYFDGVLYLFCISDIPVTRVVVCITESNKSMTEFFSFLSRKRPLLCAVFQRQQTVYIEYIIVLILSALSLALIRNTNRRKKILGNVFQSNYSSHAKIWTNASKIGKRAKIRHRLVMLSALQLHN